MDKVFTIGKKAIFNATFSSNDRDECLIDLDSIPTFTIKNASDQMVYEGISIKKTKGNYEGSWDVPGSQTEGNYFLTWNAIYGGELFQGLTETFTLKKPNVTLFKKVNDYDIIVPQIELELIKSILAYPCADELLLGNDQIKRLCIYPAMREYFVKFPILERYQQPMNNYLEIPFPDQFVYGITECRAMGKLFQSTGAVGSSFWQLVLLNKGMGFQGNSFNSYGSNMRGYNPNGLRQETRAYKNVLDTYSNDGTFNYNINKPKKVIEINATLQCEVAITWARWSNRFEDIEYERKNEVVELAQAYLLQHFAQTIGLTDDGNSDQTINAVEASSKSETLMTRIRDKWANMSDIIVMRIS
jgi:hypothetical protein